MAKTKTFYIRAEVNGKTQLYKVRDDDQLSAENQLAQWINEKAVYPLKVYFYRTIDSFYMPTELKREYDRTAIVIGKGA